jgi:hypothetical protein
MADRSPSAWTASRRLADAAENADIKCCYRKCCAIAPASLPDDEADANCRAKTSRSLLRDPFAFLSRLGQADRDRLLAALDLSASAAPPAARGAALIAPHFALDILAGAARVSSSPLRHCCLPGTSSPRRLGRRDRFVLRSQPLDLPASSGRSTAANAVSGFLAPNGTLGWFAGCLHAFGSCG